MIIIYLLIAIFIGWIWIDYYRLIDIYDKENLKYFLFTFFLGGLSVFLVVGMEFLMRRFHFRLDGTFVNDFLYSVFKIGAVEELAKLIPFLLIYFLFKNQLNEPIDYLAFISISALGFSATENTMYFYSGGANSITARAILASVSHMFDTSLIAYGIILVKFKKFENKFLTLTGFFLLAALSHGFYDFWLLYSRGTGWIVTILYFLVTISIFATILNNSINNSSYFTYKKFIDPEKVSSRILSYYAVVFGIQFLLIAVDKNLVNAIYNLIATLFTSGFIIGVTVIRLSRFKLIQGRWQKIKFELPFSFGGGSDLAGYPSSGSFLSIRVKGDPFNEVKINNFYEEYFYLLPVSSRTGEIASQQLTYIDKKLFLKNDETFFHARLFSDETKQSYEDRLLKPKMRNTTMMYGKYPIVAILKFDDEKETTDVSLSAKDFEFQEWAYIKPVEPADLTDEKKILSS